MIRRFPNRATSCTSNWIHRLEWGNSVNWNILVAEGKESKRDSLSSGERNGNSLNQVFNLGSWENNLKIHREFRRSSWNLHHRWWKSSSQKIEMNFCLSRVAWDTWNPVWISEDHLVRLNTPEWPIVNSTARERWKRTPKGEWKSPWNRCLTSCGRGKALDRVPVEEWAGDL